jgi:hypothetical protein
VIVSIALVAVFGAHDPAMAKKKPKPGVTAPKVIGKGEVDHPPATPGKPLPQKDGTVDVKPGKDKEPKTKTKAATPAAGTAAPATGATTTTTTAASQKVALRALVIGVDSADWGVATWRSTLDRVGAEYDIAYSRTQPITAGTFVGSDGVGRYNAILLTDSMQLYIDASGNYVTGLDDVEWNVLWDYERNYAVRQAVLYTSYGTWPEDYCLNPSAEGGVEDVPLNATLTTAGATLFDYLKSTAVVPITQSYVYRTRVKSGCAATPILVTGKDILGVQTKSVDGRERVALTFTSNEYLIQSNLLVYGLFRWASRGLYFGEQRHFLDVDVDDWFNSADHLFADGHVDSDPGYQMSGHDAYNANTQQNALRTKYPLAKTFTAGMAYNGSDADLSAGTTCSPNGGISTLTATSRCLRANFRWLNHTYTHPELNFTDYATSKAEMANNFTVGSQLGLSTPANVVKTGEYSGLGVYNDDPNDDVSPPTDHGLLGSNQNLLNAAKDLGVQYLHGNMSFPSHVPSCFDCGIAHPMQPSVMVVPDWPTNISYRGTAPAEEVYEYNHLYGPNGRFPYWSEDLTYTEIVDAETDVALSHVASGSVYTHTFHIANLRDYGSGHTLLFDWLDQLLAKYSAVYAVPVLNPDWPGLASYAKTRTGHFAQLGANAKGVYDPVAKTVTVSSPLAGTLTLSGSTSASSTTYGTERSAPVTVTAGGSVAVPVAPRA